jgi:signal transduction histidine kinase
MISRLEAGYSAESTLPIDLDTILHDVVELYEPLAEEMGVELEAGTDGKHKIVGNRELIGQALSNVVDNAIKYSAGSCEKPAVIVKAESAEGEVRLTVTDNGPGIPEGDRDRVTERFVRLEQSRSQPGSGLGLSLAKAVMKLHGGRLILSSEQPGLKVSMAFPASEETN